jgi:predicted nuclease of predicted toxin-antitoxin system
MMGASDEAHLAFALERGRIIVTHDDDFLRLAALGKAHAGIVYSSQQLSIGEIIRGLMLIYDVLELEDMKDKVEYL